MSLYESLYILISVLMLLLQIISMLPDFHPLSRWTVCATLDTLAPRGL